MGTGKKIIFFSGYSSHVNSRQFFNMDLRPARSSANTIDVCDRDLANGASCLHFPSTAKSLHALNWSQLGGRGQGSRVKLFPFTLMLPLLFSATPLPCCTPALSCSHSGCNVIDYSWFCSFFMRRISVRNLLLASGWHHFQV